MKKLTLLRNLLALVPNGPAGEEIESALQDAWDEIEGTDAENTTADKLLCRVENLTWERPILTFEIERHGGTVKGSSRADMHFWTANVGAGEATCSVSSYRQKTPRARSVQMEPLVDKVAASVAARESAPELDWLSEGRVRILVGKVIPNEGYRQTVKGRRKRFADALRSRMEALGWVRVEGTSSHVYEVGTQGNSQVSAANQ